MKEENKCISKNQKLIERIVATNAIINALKYFSHKEILKILFRVKIKLDLN